MLPNLLPVAKLFVNQPAGGEGGYLTMKFHAIRDSSPQYLAKARGTSASSAETSFREKAWKLRLGKLCTGFLILRFGDDGSSVGFKRF